MYFSSKEAASALFIDEDEDESAQKKKREYVFDLNTNNGLIHFMTQPYFKSTLDDGYFMVAPILEDHTENEKLPFRLTYCLQRQKWTKRVIIAIKSCVLKTLREELERKLDDHFIYCLSRMDLTSNEFQSIGDSVTDTELVDSVVKICVDRDISGKPTPNYSPVLCYVNCPGGHKFTVLAENKSLYDLVQFKMKSAKDIAKLNYFEFSKSYPIDWLSVSQKMLNLHKRFKSADECERVWKWNHDAKYRRGSFTSDEIEEFMNVLKEIGTNNAWHLLPNRINNDRTDFDYFQMYKALTKCESDYKIGKELKRQLVQSYLCHQDYNILAAKLSDIFPQINAEVARVIYARSLNPMLRKTKFTAIEDAILLVVMELEKDEVIDCESDENYYHCIMEWMPWRFTDILKERFESLFHLRVYPFTIEEDKLLLAAVNVMGRSWEKISQLFKSNKTRKGCATRYKHIKNWTDAQLEFHHRLTKIPHSLTWSSPLMKALYKLATVLQEWDTRQHISRSQLSRTEPPSENNLHLYIRSFPRSIVQKTFDRVMDYCHLNLEFHPLDQNREFCDRRTFDRNVAASWASAFHWRQIRLKPLECIENPTDFELSIYAHFDKYGRGLRPKSGIMRSNHIPPAFQLIEYPEVSRIVDLGHEKTCQEAMLCPINIKMESVFRLQEYESEETEAYLPRGYQCESTNESEAVLTMNEQLQCEPDKIQCECDVVAVENNSNDSNMEMNVKTLKTGPKSGRIKKARVAAALARWGKNDTDKTAENPQVNASAEPPKQCSCKLKEYPTEMNVKVFPVLKTGPKSKRISNIRKEAAKARWGKVKKADAVQPENTTSVKRDLKSFNIRVIWNTDSAANGNATDANAVSDPLGDPKDVKIKVEHDHNYYGRAN